MKSPIDNHRVTPPPPPDPETVAARLDALIVLASRGDGRAIEELARTQHKKLLAEARAAIGTDKQEAVDVVQAFYLSLCEAKNRFLPGEGEATRWMTRIVRAIAQIYRRGGAR